jgi:hypothetical protein
LEEEEDKVESSKRRYREAQASYRSGAEQEMLQATGGSRFDSEEQQGRHIQITGRTTSSFDTLRPGFPGRHPSNLRAQYVGRGT